MGLLESYRVIMVLVAAFFILGLVFHFESLLYIALILLVVSLISSTLSKYISSLWMKFARFIGTINSKILLTLIFYVFLTPFALMYRLIKGSPIGRQFDQNSESYFTQHDKSFEPGDFKKIW